MNHAKCGRPTPRGALHASMRSRMGSLAGTMSLLTRAELLDGNDTTASPP